MCKAPKPPKPKDPDKPEYLRNPYLDAAIGQSGAVDQLRSGRSQLRIDLGSGLSLRKPGTALPQPPANTRPAATPAPAPRNRQRETFDAVRGRMASLASI